MYGGVPTATPVPVNVLDGAALRGALRGQRGVVAGDRGGASAVGVGAPSSSSPPTGSASPKSVTRPDRRASDEHVVGLEVAVDEADRVRRRQPAPGLDEARQHHAPRPRRRAQPATDALAARPAPSRRTPRRAPRRRRTRARRWGARAAPSRAPRAPSRVRYARSPMSGRTTLSATWRCNSGSRASTTTPMPPAPSVRSTT